MTDPTSTPLPLPDRLPEIEALTASLVATTNRANELEACIDVAVKRDDLAADRIDKLEARVAVLETRIGDAVNVESTESLPPATKLEAVKRQIERDDLTPAERAHYERAYLKLTE